VSFGEFEEGAETNRISLVIAPRASPAKKTPFCKKIFGISPDHLTQKNMKRKNLILPGIAAWIGIAFAAAPAMAGTISYLPITGDSDSDISSSKTYTHAIDFGTQPVGGGVATINGVVFANGNTGNFPAIGGSSQTVGTGSTTCPGVNPGNANASITTGGMADLVRDMVFNDATAVITLTGLAPGQPYRFRLYNRQYGTAASSERGQNIGFDTDGVGTDISGAENTATFEADDATQPDPNQPTFNQVYALTYEYTLSAGVTTLTVYIDATSIGSYHLYGLTNELDGPDIVEPAVSGFSPADGAPDVYLATDLVATFNEGIALTGAGSISVTEVGGDGSSDFSIDLSNLPDADAAVSVNGAVLTIDPTSNFEPGQEYEVTISSGAIEDLAGTPNAYGGTASGEWTFTTAAQDLTAPVIVTRDPADDSPDVSVSTNIVATFDDDLVLGSGNIVIYNVTLGGAAATIDVTDSSQVTLAGKVLTINPTDPLDGLTEYAVQMDADVVRNLNDLPNAEITDTTSWSFTTKQPRITAVGSGSFGGVTPIPTSYTQPITVGDGADMLVVMTSSELGNGNMTVTYGGIAMKLAVGNKTTSAIWYLDLATPGISGTDVVVDLSSAGSRNGFAAGWVSIDGNLEAGESITLHSTGTSAPQSNTVGLTTTVETFNFVNFNANNTSKAITINSPNPTVIYTDLNIGSAEGAAAYASSVAAGSYTYQWTLGTLAPPNADYRRIDAAAFSVTTGTAFEDWAETGTLGPVSFNGDTNADGVQDGMAFLLGAENPDDNATGRLPTVTRNGSGGLVLTFNCLPIADRGDAKLYVEHSGDLGVSDDWLATVDEVPDTTDAVPDNGVTFVVTPGSPTNGVVATIAPSEAAGGKLFGRLVATEN
jgi:hypothetical protein